MISIRESEMEFGPFAEDTVYQIEKSRLHESVNNVKTVEFILMKGVREKALHFVEAKSSSPRPGGMNETRFDEFVDDISKKFLHSLNLYCSAIMNRHNTVNDIPNSFKDAVFSDMAIKFVLVIKGHQIEWLPPVQEALNRKMIGYSSIWNTQITVINDEMAARYGLIATMA